jgi:hypothetical protein
VLSGARHPLTRVLNGRQKVFGTGCRKPEEHYVVLFASDLWAQILVAAEVLYSETEGRFAGFPAKVDPSLPDGAIVLRSEIVC